MRALILACLIGACLAMTVDLVAQPWMRVTDDPATRAAVLLSHMNLTEKITMLHGPPTGDCCECTTSPLCNYTGNVAPNARLGIPQIKMNDGPQGFRDNNFPGTTTAWPSALTVAATWDTNAMFLWGRAMGKEFHDKGANVQLGPGVCLARVPKNGRNFEYLSGEDPFLGYTLVQPTVQGIQSQGVIANAKHYVLNNQETNRQTVSDNADERTRFEMYYQPYIGATEAGVGSMMCSYNKIYGAWSCENNSTLATDLKARIGFKGFVMSDWGATHSTSLVQGLDMEMPAADFMGAALLAAVQAGTIPESYVDDAVVRILIPMFQMGIFDNPNPNVRSNNVTSDEHNDLARKLSAQSTVLLKNENNILPLNGADLTLRIALIGFADASCITHSEGSGKVVPSRVITPLAGITNRLGDASRVTFDSGANLTSAAATASRADVAIVFVGTTSGEGSDRTSLNVDANGDNLVLAVAAAQPNTIVVVATPGAILTNLWSAQVAAILTNFMPGQEVGNAIADVLFGDVNPSAKLPVTFPVTDNDEQMTPLQYPGLPPNDPVYANYTEGLFFGYRWYDEHAVSPAFPFGHGLSYTTFTYSNLQVVGTTVSFTLTNSGPVDGAEVPQLYIGFPASANEPPKVLRGFQKVPLYPGQSQTVAFTLRERDLSIWDVNAHDWAAVHGQYNIFVGSSSRDIRLTTTLNY